MTERTKKRLRDWSVAVGAALSALGWGLTVAAKNVDMRYVKQHTYDSVRAIDERRQLRDSIRADLLVQKVDSANIRLQQIICGRRLQEGCR